MTPSPSAAADPLRLIQVLEAEFTFLHCPHAYAEAAMPKSGRAGAGCPDADAKAAQEKCDLEREYLLRMRVHGLYEKRSAICFSGGGVRSATFSLGVIQALAKTGWLGTFHYMSSVSGGGYIASWLSSWIARANGNTADVIAAIARTGTNQPAEPGQIRKLRAYSNFLSPVHGLSMDLVTLLATFFRNLALHWSVLIPLLAVFVIFPRLNLAVTRAMLRADRAMLIGAVILLGIIGIFGFVNILRNLPSYPLPSAFRKKFVPFCYVPMLTATIMLGWIIPAICTSKNLLDVTGFALGGAGLLYGCKGLALLMQGETSLSMYRSLDFVPITIAGALSGVLFHGLLTIVDLHGIRTHSVDLPFDVAAMWVVFCVPSVLAILWICMTFYVGVSRPLKAREVDHEWWARAGAYIFWSILAWLIVNAVVIYGPWLVLKWPLAKVTAGSASVLGIATGAYGYWSKNNTALQRRLRSAGALLGDRIFELAAGAFLIAVAIVFSFALAILAGSISSGSLSIFALHLDELLPAYEKLTVDARLEIVGAMLIGLLVVAAGTAVLVGTNTFSLHNMYGNRLVRAYLGAANEGRQPDQFTDFDPADNLDMVALQRSLEQAPTCDRKLFHVVNIALNLVKPSGSRLDWQQRKAAPFTVSPLHAGAASTGFQPAATYAGDKGISLARAMTISGAAATPNMGYHSSRLVAFAMTFFNIRLGWWLPNPGAAGRKRWHRREPQGGMVALLKESFAKTTDESEYVYLSDGGHFENLGLYEMVRRRCHLIVVVDASCDPEYRFDDLENAVRKIRVDMGISIVFPGGLPTPAWSRGDLNRHQHSSIGTIHYSAIDGAGTDGVVIYIKPLLSGDEPLDVTRYAAVAKRNQRNPFPHHPTSDQFFDEVRFESYRALGYHSVMHDAVLGSNPRNYNPLLVPNPRAVDATAAEVAAAEVNRQESPPASTSAGAMQAMSAVGVMGLGAMAIPGVVALGLATVFALGKMSNGAPGEKGSSGEAGASGETRVAVKLDALDFQDTLTERFTQMLEATQSLQKSVTDVSSENQKIVMEMQVLLEKEISLLKAARSPETRADTSITLNTLLKFREALRQDPNTWSDPALVKISDTLDKTRELLASEKIAGKLGKIEIAVERSNPRVNVRAADGGRQ